MRAVSARRACRVVDPRVADLGCRPLSERTPHQTRPVRGDLLPHEITRRTLDLGTCPASRKLQFHSRCPALAETQTKVSYVVMAQASDLRRRGDRTCEVVRIRGEAAAVCCAMFRGPRTDTGDVCRKDGGRETCPRRDPEAVHLRRSVPPVPSVGWPPSLCCVAILRPGEQTPPSRGRMF